MSQQEQPRRRPSDSDHHHHQQQHAVTGEQAPAAVRYGDVFPVSGDLAGQPIAPQDAVTMQSAESTVIGQGQTLRGGPAATMQSAAMANERTGVVRHDQATDATAAEGVTVSEKRVPGGRVVTEFVAGQAVGQYPAPDDPTPGRVGAADITTKVTIGEALEATALAAGNAPVEHSDAAAIHAAEARAAGTRLDASVPGGLAVQAQSAAAANKMVGRKDKTTLGNVLADAASKMVADKAVDRSDAVRVADAETNEKGDAAARPGGVAAARPGGVAAAMAVAARLNRDDEAV